MAKKPVYDGSGSCGGCDTRWTGLSRCHCGACHRTFSGIGLFDAHRRNDRCIDPALIIGRTGKHKGQRLAFLTDGLWQGVEDPADRGASLRKWRAGNAA